MNEPAGPARDPAACSPRDAAPGRSPARESWYIYYKVDGDAAAAIAQRVRAMLATIAATTGIEGRLLRRCDSNDVHRAEVTLLEVYDRIDDATRLEAALADGLAGCGFAPALLAARRRERFCEMP